MVSNRRGDAHRVFQKRCDSQRKRLEEHRASLYFGKATSLPMSYSGLLSNSEKFRQRCVTSKLRETDSSHQRATTKLNKCTIPNTLEHQIPKIQNVNKDTPTTKNRKTQKHRNTNHQKNPNFKKKTPNTQDKTNIVET